jgi:hypothetical protein
MYQLCDELEKEGQCRKYTQTFGNAIVLLSYSLFL